MAKIHRLPLISSRTKEFTVHVRLPLKWLDILPLSGGLILLASAFLRRAYLTLVHSCYMLDCRRWIILIYNVVQKTLFVIILSIANYYINNSCIQRKDIQSDISKSLKLTFSHNQALHFIRTDMMSFFDNITLFHILVNF